jgi:putative tricarboxylic transport membrane protein
MLAGIYYGAQYGGSTTAILVNLPGETSSVVTCIDGYQMARRGRAGWRLPRRPRLLLRRLRRHAAAGRLRVPLAEVAFKFGPAEYFSLMVLGLIGAVVLASGSLLKAIAMIVLGLLGGIVGTDVNSGVSRYASTFPELTDGIGFVAVAMGVFGLRRNHHQPGAEGAARGVHQQGHGPVPDQGRLQAHGSPPCCAAPSWVRRWASCRAAARLLAAFGAYSLEKKVKNSACLSARAPSKAWPAPESANNAAAQTSFIPLLTLGIPPNAVMALMVGAMTIHNIQPGPQVMTSNPDAVLGPDRLDVARQPDAGDPEPAADRHLDQAADRALPLPVPGHPGVLLHRRLHRQQQHLRRLHDGIFGSSAMCSSSSAANPRRCCWASCWAR